MPGQIWPLGLQGNPAPHPVDIALQAIIPDQRCRAEQIAGDLLSNPHFFFLRGIACHQRLQQLIGRFFRRCGRLRRVYRLLLRGRCKFLLE